MKKQKFNFDEIFSFAWSKTKQHAWFLVCSALIYGVILSASMDIVVVRGMAFKVIGPLGMLVSGLICLSLLSISLIIVRNESFSFADLFNRLKSPRLVINFAVLMILYITAVSVFVVPFLAGMSVALTSLYANGFATFTSKMMSVLLGTIVMLLPGIYIAVRFKFFPYVLLENEHMSIIEVIKHTKKITCCAFWSLLLFFIMLMVLNIVGFLAFGFGLIFTVPVSILALAHLYRNLEAHTH